MSTMISVQNLIKSYNGVDNVLKGISFDIKENEIVGILGVNGAGKTTTLECIEGIRSYGSGNINTKGSIGVQLQSSSLPGNIKVKEAITLFKKWRKSSKSTNDYLSLYELDSIKDKQYIELSTGQKRKLHLTLVCIGDPDIIILDEPTAGLDVESRAMLHENIRMMKGSGKTLLLASHDMAEVEQLCDRIIVIVDGNVKFLGTVDEFKMNKSKEKIIRVRFENPEIEFIEGSSHEYTDNGYIQFRAVDVNKALVDILKEAGDNTIEDISIEGLTLEQAFLQLIREGD